VTVYVQTLLRAADHLADGRGLDYRERLQLERAVFRLTSVDTIRAFGWVLSSMYPSALEELAAHCEIAGIRPDHPTLGIVNDGFAVMHLIASIANADPYVLNENFSRVVHRYSTGVATLPSALRDFAAAHSQAPSQGDAVT
jgi:hypothetical protein